MSKSIFGQQVYHALTLTFALARLSCFINDKKFTLNGNAAESVKSWPHLRHKIHAIETYILTDVGTNKFVRLMMLYETFIT